jgi:U3 small nucleolar RNA-associated protein 23
VEAGKAGAGGVEALDGAAGGGGGGRKVERGAARREGAGRGEQSTQYLVATMDADLRVSLRLLGGVPTLLMNRNVLVMEPPSRVARDAAGAKEGALMELDAESRRLVEHMVGSEIAGKKRARRGPKEPNPLSCKKPRVIRDKPRSPSHKRNRRKTAKDE